MSPRAVSADGGGGADSVITLHRSRAIVAAVPQEDGSVRVIDGAFELTLTAEQFAKQYAPATVAEVRQLAPTSPPSATALPSPTTRALPAGKKKGPGRGNYPRKPKAAKSPKPGKAAERASVAIKRDTNEERAWDRIKDLYQEGVAIPKIVAIVKHVGAKKTTASMIYSRAHYYKWPKGKAPKAGGPKKPAVAGERTSSTQPTPQRRCEECGQQTSQDPCSNCGERWNQ